VLASGTRLAGYVLYLQGGYCVWEYVYSQKVRYLIRSEATVPIGRVELRYEFTRTGPRRGQGALFVSGNRVGTAAIAKTWPVHGTTGGLYCGRDGGTPVSGAYTPPFTFTGVIHRVVVELEKDGDTDRNSEARQALAEE